ncbi:kinetochore protein NDC80 homolog isoform X1 [Gopherus flavomarginatus]|uniref:kinetochore protein NDC80 homolog isoform X1 n=1 Tax=Gopherus flavomarginatus TaxID=286002 RepID=UPI0021CB9B94|nr:kinetochore protein NDC80 homolog isoform X1 [Gopherus flavomarginatus]
MKQSSSSCGSNGRASLLPIRVQDTSRAGLYTPQATERSKLSVSKYTGGSEGKTSFSVKRTSGSGVSRNTLWGFFSGTEKLKDPRPLHDKAYIQQCIRQLCEFLVEKGYAQNVSVKSLQTPSTKDFFRIFAFIYAFLCPSYELPDSKIEEEIPKVFKELGYPFPLPKSSMYTVGVPHVWPQVAAALVWLIDCIKIYSVMRGNIDVLVDAQCWSGEGEDEIVVNKLLMEYTEKCYDHFMNGGDAFEEMDAELQAKLNEVFKVDHSKLKTLEAENKRLNEEIARRERERESEPDRVETLRKLKASLQADVEKYQAYMTNLESHSAVLYQKLHSLTEVCEESELEVEMMKQENARLQHTIDNQLYTAVDIERINHEKDELQQTINKLTKELETERQQLWAEELKYARGKESIEAQLDDYHKLARKLKLIPAGMENSRGHDFEIKFNPEDGPNSLAKYRRQINVPLMQIIDETEEAISKASNKKIILEDSLEQLNVMMAEKKSNIKLLKEEAQKLDDHHKQKLKVAEEEEEKSAAELQALKIHKNLIEAGVNEGLNEAMNELHEIQKKHQIAVRTTNEEKIQLLEKLYRVLEMVAFHVGSVEKYLAEHNAKADTVFEEFMSEDLLDNLKQILAKYKSKANAL